MLLRKGTKYDKLWNEKALSELAEEDLDIRNLINVYRSLKTEEKEVMRRIRKTASEKKPAYVNDRYWRVSYDTGSYDINRFKTPKFISCCCVLVSIRFH